MTRYFISDTHWGHARIISLCNRPFKSVSHMNEMLIKNWNDTVGPDDEVFHLGDVALGPNSEWDGILTRLNGYNTLVEGNHDRIFRGMPEKEQRKFAERYAGWFDIVTHEITNFRLEDGTMVNMSHFPYDGDSHDADRHKEFRQPDNGRVLIHGHTHQSQKVSRSESGTLQIHVGVDAWGYKPVSEEEIISLIQGAE